MQMLEVNSTFLLPFPHTTKMLQLTRLLTSDFTSLHPELLFSVLIAVRDTHLIQSTCRP